MNAQQLNARIATNLSRTLRRRRLSQRALAQLAGYPQPLLSQLLGRKRDWNTRHLAAITQALNIDPAELIQPIRHRKT